MLSTQAVYVIDFNNFSSVIRRVLLENIEILLFTKSKDSMLIKIKKDSFGDIFFTSSKIDDIIKSLQQLKNEKTMNYIPWVVVNKISELLKVMNKTHTIQPVIHDFNLIKIVVEYGTIGESLIIIKKCEVNSLSHYLFITDLSIYLLDFNHSLSEKILVSQVTQVKTNTTNKICFFSKNSEICVSLNLSKGVFEEITKGIESSVVFKDTNF